MKVDFVHLHLHSEYSLLDGACRIADVVKEAKAQGHRALALTDHGVLYGAVAFVRACEKEGIQPIVGCEVYVAKNSRHGKQYGVDSDFYHLVLLCENEVGYRNLMTLVSTSYIEGFYQKPRIDFELLSQYAQGLIALSGCVGGQIPQLLLQQDFLGAQEIARAYQALFGDRFYLEMQDHGMQEESLVNEGLRSLSRLLSIPLVVTNDVHYVQKKDAQTQAVLMAIQTNRTLAQGRLPAFSTDEFYYKSTQEMQQLFPQDTDAIANTVAIANRCHFSFPKNPKTEFPSFPLPHAQSPEDYLRTLAKEGWQKRMEAGQIPNTQEQKQIYLSRIEYELEVICRMGYAPYYLIVWDFVCYAKRHQIPVGPGRGSGAGSLVAYCIGITEVDSIAYGLLFERFLNPERVSMPDFDIDFCYDRRGEVLRYVSERYGADHVAQIITFGTLAPRAAVRDVGRVMGMSYAQVDRVAKRIPSHPGITFEKAMQDEELQRMEEQDPQVHALLTYARALEGMPRHASTHAAGVVITCRPVCEYVPLAIGGDGIITQYDMDTVASLGLLKFDMLGLRYLTILSDTEKLVQKKDPSFSLVSVDCKDPDTYAMLSLGHTDGIFQLESAGMRRLLCDFRPQNLFDIMQAIALYRPGPMESIPRLLQNRKDPAKISYLLPQLEPILSETYGCMVYQEQVMQICREVAGYSYGRADMVRRAMAKKKSAEMEREEQYFLAGATERGMDPAVAKELFSKMAGFANYAFNKSHAASYAILSFQSAYLKCHFPKEYFCALLNSVLGNTQKTAEYIADAEQMGIAVLPPDVAQGEAECAPVADTNAIRFGLCAIRNIGKRFADQIVEERKRGPYSSFGDFLTRLSHSDKNRKNMEMLIKSGALDCFGRNRSVLFASFEEMLALSGAGRQDGIEGQMDLFSGFVGSQNEQGLAWNYTYPDLSEWKPKEKLLFERESLGMTFSGHLLDEYATQIASVATAPIARVLLEAQEGEIADRTPVTLCGLVGKVTQKTTKKGEKMLFFPLEDRYAQLEVLVFPTKISTCAPFLTQENAVCVKGTLSVREDEVKLLLTDVTPLSSLPNPISPAKESTQTQEPCPSFASTLFLRLPSEQEDSLDSILQLLVQATPLQGEGTAVRLYFAESKTYSDSIASVAVTQELLYALQAELGKENVVLRQKRKETQKS